MMPLTCTKPATPRHVRPRHPWPATLLLALFVATGAGSGHANDTLAIKLSSPPKSNELRAARCQVISAGAWADGTVAHGEQLAKLMKRNNGRLPTRNLAPLHGLCDNIILFQLLQSAMANTAAPLSESFVTWLFGDDHRSTAFLEQVDPQHDNLPRVIAILAELHRLETRDPDAFFPLMLAISVVWDSPRPPLHAQIASPSLLSPEAVIGNLYTFFRDTYASPRTAMPLRNLTVSALTYVVDTPVPISELAWLQENVRPRRWDDIFAAIRYDDARAQLGQYSWNNGPYSVAAIQQRGGICVDQAYFTTLAARAHGVPAIFFAGSGNSGGHAWLAIMERNGNWEMDIGRFRTGGFTTGHATDPQTGSSISDHMLAYTCSRTLQANRSSKADELTRSAVVLDSAHYRQAAIVAAEMATQTLPTHLAAWNLREQWAEPNSKERLAVLDQCASALRQYPDVVASVRIRQAAILRAQNQHQQADRLLKTLPAKVGRRDDLARAVGIDQVDAALAQNKPEEARKILEKLLTQQKNQGAKTFGLVETYLNLTRDTDQTNEAVRFLKRYLPSLQRHSDQNIDRDPRFTNIFDQFLYQAYINNGDDKQAERLLKRAQRK
ncbi:hypothetical protein [Oligosphaera ethanolica]|uniref:Transglutaminase-like domain-containing protein n=1 Tax=Oligosphaera ethanolica TaxID=760260 RepID=A0AAE3VCZ3_9BACT|nr:hypothetical protein [Oligosphaera ethanolica]MDQ0288228.1 hypothetical protein [Oligosphaera ethanolica]